MSSAHLHPSQWGDGAVSHSLKRVAAPKERQQAESGAVSRKQGPLADLDGSPKGPGTAGRGQARGHLPIACTWHRARGLRGRRTEGPAQSPPWEEARVPPGRGKDRAPRINSWLQKRHLREGSPCLLRSEPRALVYRAAWRTMKASPERPSESTSTGQHSCWH